LHHWPLLGPIASVGNFYFGPIYYYLITPFTWAFGFAPYGAVFTSTFFSLLEIWVFYKLLKLWFPEPENTAGSTLGQTAILGALLLVFSLYDIQNAYYISNPTLLPFFLVLFFYCLTLVLRGRPSWLAVAGLGIGFSTAIQLHATSMLLLPLVLAAVLIAKRPRLQIAKIAMFFVTVIVLWLPYIYFELTNNFANLRKILATGSGAYGWLPNPESLISLFGFLDRALIYKNVAYNFVVLYPKIFLLLLPLELIILLSFVLLLRKRKGPSVKVMISAEGKIILTAWILLGCAIFLFYRMPLQHFYFLILWPAPVLFLSWFLAWLEKNSKKMFWVVLVSYLLLQVVQMPLFLKVAENRKFDYKQLQFLFTDIARNASGESYNLIDISYDPNLFGYYLRLFGVKDKLVRNQAIYLYYISESGSDEQAVVPQGYQKAESFFRGDIIATKYYKMQK